jgi:hypothetical protein
VKRLGLCAVVALACGILFVHGGNLLYLPVKAVTVAVWTLLLAASLLAMRVKGVAGPVLLTIGALIAVDVAVIVDSAMLYDITGIWSLDGGVPLPYQYSPLWAPAALWPGDTVFGVPQEAIRAGDFEWQGEQVAPVALMLVVLSAIFVAASLARRATARHATMVDVVVDPAP